MLVLRKEWGHRVGTISQDLMRAILGQLGNGTILLSILLIWKGKLLFTDFSLKIYSCGVWDAVFDQRGNMLKHMKQHMFESVEERQIFECPVKGCTRSDDKNDTCKFTELYNFKVLIFFFLKFTLINSKVLKLK